ncbi:TonB-linked SusC/RagA family outer membrane protein [Chitinophaga dinghuensis]|uniref:TonB-linked SusC/RagA family outer membrane protein n=1 Tax=Chitinophaga dinghuensis TaxID=1539050 RepID=A0A327VWA8_9BACT|nr:TonB-dependent receptor [Chitinophaga dinghuensis]RAJ79124.1 TonB-linked SusC/RagA family outer membrane protein [Chitinophaga dinghuensis]
MIHYLPRSSSGKLRLHWMMLTLIPAAGLMYTAPAQAATGASGYAAAAFFQQDPSQYHVLTGVVTDEKSQPVPGVTIAIKGTSHGTVTDEKGAYTLRIPNTVKSPVLVFTSMGFTPKEVAFANQKTLNQQMVTDQKALGEVVVVGYGTQRKVNVVGAVSAIKVDEQMAGRAVSNASSALSGMVPGLSATQSSGMAGKNGADLVIRGMGTVNNAKPLVVVDGMPDVDINTVNMNDIESISVLKDATSASVYGSRAANGVILITTKSGKGQKKTLFNFTGYYGVTQPTKSYDFMADYARALTLEQRLQQVGTARNLLNFKDGTIDQWMAMSMVDPLRYPNTDWWSIIMRDGVNQNYNLSASGGNDISNFFASVGVQDEKGLQINNTYKRYNARFNFDYKLRKNMNVGMKFAGVWSKYMYAMDEGFTDADGGNVDLQYAIAGITPYDPVTGKFGGVMAYGEDPQAFNPYMRYMQAPNNQNRQQLNANVYYTWEPIKGLTGRVDYSLGYYNQFAYGAAMPTIAYNFQTMSNGSRTYYGSNAGISNTSISGYKTQLNGGLTYHKAFNKNHDLTILGLYSEEYWYERNLSASRNDRVYPNLHEIDGALTSIMSAGGNSSTEGLRSYIGRVNYTAYDKYLLEVNFRTDGSSKFLPGHRYGFFPSAALGWRFVEENFIKQYTNGWLSNGKLRASYGTLGNNSGVGRFEQQQTLALATYFLDRDIQKGLVYQKMVNQDLTWETTSVFNLGLDLGFFDSRLNAELDYYDRLTTNMNRPSDMSILLTGAYNAPRKNIGNLRNRGVELNLNWTDKLSNGLRYSIIANASYNRTNLEKWNEYLGRGYQFLNMPYRFVYTYTDRGIAQTWQDIYNATPQGASPGDILRNDVNGDGIIDGNDKVAQKNFQRERPTTNFSLGGNVGWKGFDFSFLLQGSAGRKDFWLNNYNNTNFSAQRYAATWDHWNNPWSLDNRDGAWPRLGGYSGNRDESTFWLDNLAYLRLKNLQLGYTLPQNLMKLLKINSVRIYGSAENIATITSYRGLDPEVSGNKNTAYPLLKSYSVGLNVGF